MKTINISPQTHDATAIRIESLLTRKQKQEIECDLVKKSAICKEEGTKGEIIVPCLK
jgi:hypothetical protein